MLRENFYFCSSRAQIFTCLQHDIFFEKKSLFYNRVDKKSAIVDNGLKQNKVVE